MQIKINNLSKTYQTKRGETPIFENQNLLIPSSKMTAIVGESGCGKSSLLKIIGLIDKGFIGDIYFDNTRIDIKNKEQIDTYRHDHIGFIFQDYLLIPELTVLQNIMMPFAFEKRENTNKIEIQAIEICEKLGLSQKINNLPQELSGGQQQRTAIARCLLKNPDILLADEPTGNLDVRNSKEIIEILQKLKSEGKTIVVVTHDENIAHYADNIITIKDGKICS
jgi:ABC-type lipoprotein export system ATPase subunit